MAASAADWSPLPVNQNIIVRLQWVCVINKYLFVILRAMISFVLSELFTKVAHKNLIYQ